VTAPGSAGEARPLHALNTSKPVFASADGEALEALHVLYSVSAEFPEAEERLGWVADFIREQGIAGRFAAPDAPPRKGPGKDPRGPVMTITHVSESPTGSETLLKLSCGHVARVNQIYHYKVGAESRCFQCGPCGSERGS
jgi:hypothetical protein